MIDMRQQSGDPKVPSHRCSNWTEIARCLEAFPSSEVNYAEDGEMRTAWVFRGLADSSYLLEPTIERQARFKNMSWRALEQLVTLEFKSRARMHLDATLIPDSKDELTWLAHMQHYGIPTRLLDFTYSPFVALYFAIREQRKRRTRLRLWAIDAIAVNNQFKIVTYKAERAARERAGKKEKFEKLSIHPDDFSTDADSTILEMQETSTLLAKSLRATGTYRAGLEGQGCVAVASPPAFNPRLASQQGVFLVNCAEGLTFRDSLSQMMARCGIEWCKRFDITRDASSEIEQRLFQMNVHEQSLFPDIEGLAGFIRQRARLHWK